MLRNIETGAAVILSSLTLGAVADARELPNPLLTHNQTVFAQESSGTDMTPQDQADQSQESAVDFCMNDAVDTRPYSIRILGSRTIAVSEHAVKYSDIDEQNDNYCKENDVDMQRSLSVRLYMGGKALTSKSEVLITPETDNGEEHREVIHTNRSLPIGKTVDARFTSKVTSSKASQAVKKVFHLTQKVVRKK